MQEGPDIQTSLKATYERYMLRCIQLAKNALGTAAPNPMVGCLIIENNKVIGEGYTSPYGGPHAEVNAIASVQDKTLLRNATLFVTLEPCSHHGKTPPCVDLILELGIPEVVIGIEDPHSKVAGKGIQKLKDAGRKVKVGILAEECRFHHRRFLTFQLKERPYILLKWAQSNDGFMAPEKEKRSQVASPYWITNERSRQIAHKWRSEEAAILVGTKTVLEDNPTLNTRLWAGKSPWRIFIDKDLKIEGEYHLFDGSCKTIVLTQKSDKEQIHNTVIYEEINFNNKVVEQILAILYKHQLSSLIIEGGRHTLSGFISKGLWDEARIFTADINLEKGLKAPDISGKEVSNKRLQNDQLKIILND